MHQPDTDYNMPAGVSIVASMWLPVLWAKERSLIEKPVVGSCSMHVENTNG